MYKQCPVLYNNSYAYGLTTRYIIRVIADPPVGLCTYVRICNGCTLLLSWTVFTCTFLKYLLICSYVLVLTCTYLLTYLLAHLLGYTCTQLLIC